jgi:ABC-type branched-subunit amino acid transport system ATPase component
MEPLSAIIKTAMAIKDETRTIFWSMAVRGNLVKNAEQS